MYFQAKILTKAAVRDNLRDKMPSSRRSNAYFKRAEVFRIVEIFRTQPRFHTLLTFKESFKLCLKTLFCVWKSWLAFKHKVVQFCMFLPFQIAGLIYLASYIPQMGIFKEIKNCKIDFWSLEMRDLILYETNDSSCTLFW